MTIRFDDAWSNAFEVAKQAAENTHRDVALVRDMLGRVSLVIDDSADPHLADTATAEPGERLAVQVGPFIGPTGVTLASGLARPGPSAEGARPGHRSGGDREIEHA